MIHVATRLNSKVLSFALIVGSFVFAVNHGGAFVKGEMNSHRWLSTGLGYAIPLITGVYCPCAKRTVAPKINPRTELDA